MIESLPDIFLPYQKEAARIIDRSLLTVIEKSRRTGFSWALAAIACFHASPAKSEGGMDVLYMGYEKDMTREFIDYVGDFATAFQMAASEIEEFEYILRTPNAPDQSIGAFRVKFDSKFEIIALPSVPRALRGKQGMVILDEAAFADDLDAVMKAAMAHLMWGGKVVICSTHNGETNPFNVLVNDVRAGRQKGSLFRLTFDEAVEQGLYHRVCLTLNRPWTAEGEAAWKAEILEMYRDNADEELNVIPNPSSGVYLPGPLIEARSQDGIPVLRYDAPVGMAEWAPHLQRAEIQDFCQQELHPILQALDPAEPIAMGEDFGRIRDLTVMVFLGIAKDTKRHVRLVIELRGVPFECQREILFFACDRIQQLRALKMDAGGNGAYLAEVALTRYGARVEEIRFTEQWYRENMPPLKAAFEDNGIVIPADRDIHNDLRLLKLIRGVARIADRTRVDEKKSRHGDAAIALALAYYGSRSPFVEYAYEPAAPRGDDTAQGRKWLDRADEDDDDDRTRSGRSGMMPDLRGGWAA